MVSKQNVVTGIDIGTTKIACTVGSIKDGSLEIVGFSVKPNNGVRKGVICDIEETVSSISACLEELERTSGVPITSCTVGINGNNILSVSSKGVIAVSRADGEITEADIDRVIESAKSVSMPPNKEILHIVPRYFSVDGQTEIKDPTGMTGIRLEVEANVIGCSTSSIKNLSKCINQAGLDIDSLVFSPLAASKILLSKKQKESGVALIDLGSGTTSLTIFEEGDVIHCAVFAIGSMHITNDIAIGLRTSLEIAEEIKIKHATPHPKKIRDTETIDLAKIDSHETEKVSRKYVCEITEARLTEILSLVKDELKKIGRDGMLPAGIIFTGGGSELDGLTEFTKEYLRLPAQIGKPNLEISGVVDKLDNPRYATSVGLMFWGLEESSNEPQKKFSIGEIGGFVNKAKGIFKQFMP